MTIAEIFETFTIGSHGFVQAVVDNCGYEISREEIERIASKAKAAEEFQGTWENEDWWTDAKNEASE